MKKSGWIAKGGMIFLMGSLMVLAACSSSSNSPTGPSGIGQGKALYRGQVTDSGGQGVEGAEITVTPVPDGGVSPIVSGADGNFEVILPPGDVATEYTFEYWAVDCEVVVCPVPPAEPDPICVDEDCADEPEVLVWSDSVVVTPGNEIDPVEPEVVSNGIGECVSECVRLYKPGSGVPPEDLIPLGATKNGNFNATPCVQFCKENFRGVVLPGDSNCNPFYLTYPVCNGEPADPGPGVPVDAAGVDDPKPKKPKKPKSNNGNGNGNS